MTTRDEQKRRKGKAAYHLGRRVQDLNEVKDGGAVVGDGHLTRLTLDLQRKEAMSGVEKIESDAWVLLCVGFVVVCSVYESWGIMCYVSVVCFVRALCVV